jgi:hypothetical protein
MINPFSHPPISWSPSLSVAEGPVLLVPTSLQGLQALGADGHGAGFGQRVRDDFHDAPHHLEKEQGGLGLV